MYKFSIPASVYFSFEFIFFLKYSEVDWVELEVELWEAVAYSLGWLCRTEDTDSAAETRKWGIQRPRDPEARHAETQRPGSEARRVRWHLTIQLFMLPFYSWGNWDHSYITLWSKLFSCQSLHDWNKFLIS